MITRVQALFYKGFKYLDVALNPFVILVGPNASGKSTFIDIFNFIRDTLIDGPEAAVQKRSSQFMELLWNQIGTRIEFAIEIAIPAPMSEVFRSARYELSVALDDRLGIVIENEYLWLLKEGAELLEPGKDHTRQCTIFPSEPIAPEFIITQRKKTPIGWRKIISKSAQGNDYFRSETTDWNIIYRFGPYKASLARIPEDEARFPISLWIKKILMENIQFLQLNSIAMRWPCRPDSPVAFQMEGNNLPKVIKYLRDEHPKNFDQWLKHVRSALPEVDRITIQERPENRSLYLQFEYLNKNWVPSWLLSDGTLRLLAQTLIAYLPEKDRLFMIEEPENGLHPLAIESVYQSLSSCYDNQIILATHSPGIIRLAEPRDIICFSKTESGLIDICPGLEHPRLKNWMKGIDLATLHAAGVLQ
ncbi:MAG: methylation-associated defense system AAA family ATPase MAD3 [Candidatus Zhuqueibacterota bacterium]